MAKIRERGKEGEKYFEYDNALSRYERAHHGKDYVKTVHDSSGRERKEPHEVKRNNSPLSKKQKKTWGLKVDRYIDTPYGPEKRTEDRFGNKIEQDPLTRKWRKVKKHGSGLSALLGSSSSSKRTNSSSRYDSIWGSGSSSKRKKSSGYDSMFGLGGSKRKKSGGIW